MSDLTATNCGCNDSCNGVSTANYNNGGCGCGCSWIWILILLFAFGGNGFGRSGNGCGCNNGGGFNLLNNNGSCCEWLIWILLLSTFCGGNN